MGCGTTHTAIFANPASRRFPALFLICAIASFSANSVACGGGSSSVSNPGPQPVPNPPTPSAQNKIAYFGADALRTTTVLYTTNPNGQPDTLVDLRQNPPVEGVSDLADVLFPRWSPDGRRIAAQAVPVTNQNPPRGKTDLFIFDPTGANLKRVSNYQLTTGAIPIALFNAFSPDSQRLALSVLSLTTDPSFRIIQVFQTLQIYSSAGAVLNTFPDIGCVTLNTVGTCLGQLPTTADLFGVDWSPNGNLLLIPLATFYPCPGVVFPFAVATEIWSVNLDRNPPVKTQITRANINPCSLLTPAVANVSAAFSPDGTRLAFVRWTRALGGPVTNTSIRVIKSDGTNEREVVSFNNVQTYGLSWSPDGHNLVFDKGKPNAIIPNLIDLGTGGIWLINVEACPSPGASPCGTSLTGPITPNGRIGAAPSWNWGK